VGRDAFVRDLVENFDATIVEVLDQARAVTEASDEGGYCRIDEAGPANAGEMRKLQDELASVEVEGSRARAWSR